MEAVALVLAWAVTVPMVLLSVIASWMLLRFLAGGCKI